MYAVSTCTAHSIHPDRRPEARLVVSNDVPCEGERHYATDALTRFAMRVLDEHVIGRRDEYTSRTLQDGHAASAHRGVKQAPVGQRAPLAPCFLVLSYPDPHPQYVVREPYASDPFHRTGSRSRPLSEDGSRPLSYHDPAPMFGQQREPLYRHDAGSLAANRRQYLGMVALIDEQIGRLLSHVDAIGIGGERSIVILTSDHGELMGAHGMGQKMNPYDEAIRVPFVLRWSGHVPAGTSVACPADSVDVVPTLLGLIGLPAPPGARSSAYTSDGEALHASLLGATPSPHSSVGEDGNERSVGADGCRAVRFTAGGGAFAAVTSPTHVLMVEAPSHANISASLWAEEHREQTLARFACGRIMPTGGVTGGAAGQRQAAIPPGAAWGTHALCRLYDRRSDPQQLVNLFDSRPEVTLALLGRLHGHTLRMLNLDPVAPTRRGEGERGDGERGAASARVAADYSSCDLVCSYGWRGEEAGSGEHSPESLLCRDWYRQLMLGWAKQVGQVARLCTIRFQPCSCPCTMCQHASTVYEKHASRVNETLEARMERKQGRQRSTGGAARAPPT